MQKYLNNLFESKNNKPIQITVTDNSNPNLANISIEDNSIIITGITENTTGNVLLTLQATSENEKASVILDITIRKPRYSLSVTNTTNAMYPSGFFLENRVVAGNITQFLTSSNSSTSTDFSTNSNITLKTVLDGGTFFQAALTGCMFTKRVQVGEAFQSTFDFRLVSSPTNLNSIITY